MAADAVMLSELAVESDFADSPFKHELLNKMKQEINKAINNGYKSTTLNPELRSKVNQNFRPSELRTIFERYGYTVLFRSSGGIDEISWENAKPQEQHQYMTGQF